MASSALFAPRYAQAFASVVASAHLDHAAARAQMHDFADTLTGSHELRNVLMDPSIPADQKLSVVDALAERLGMIREVRNFIAVIMDHKRLGEFNEIVTAYDRLAQEGQGVAQAEVTSAFDLNDDDRTELEAQIARLAGSGVQVTYRQDKLLLGGAIIRIGSTIYDGSLRAQFEQLKRSLMTA